MDNTNVEFNKKVFFEHLIFTFLIMMIFWIPCLILGINGIVIKDHFWLYIPWLLGGLSPAIASYIVLKKNNQIKGFLDYLKQVFDFKHKIWGYLLAICFPLIQVVLMCLLSGYKKGLPLYYLPFMILAMIFAGGLEEAGWRYITYTELNKKFGFIISVLITAILWWVWHTPLFFIPGVSQYHKNFLVFGIMVLGFSFVLATIKELTGSVWLCVLCHAIINSLGNFFHYDLYGSYMASSITTAILIALSLVSVYGFKYIKKKNDNKLIAGK